MGGWRCWLPSRGGGGFTCPPTAPAGRASPTDAAVRHEATIMCSPCCRASALWATRRSHEHRPMARWCWPGPSSARSDRALAGYWRAWSWSARSAWLGCVGADPRRDGSWRFGAGVSAGPRDRRQWPACRPPTTRAAAPSGAAACVWHRAGHGLANGCRCRRAKHPSPAAAPAHPGAFSAAGPCWPFMRLLTPDLRWRRARATGSVLPWRERRIKRPGTARRADSRSGARGGSPARATGDDRCAPWRRLERRPPAGAGARRGAPDRRRLGAAARSTRPTASRRTRHGASS